LRKDFSETKDRISQLECYAAQSRKNFHQSVIDSRSIEAIHDLRNYTSYCPRFIAIEAGNSSWDDLKSATKSHKERNSICMSVFDRWGLEIKEEEWEAIQDDVTLELGHTDEHQRIVVGMRQELLDAISKSTECNTYHDAFSRLVNFVDAHTMAEGASTDA
jgi:hypothetical protein